MRYLTVKECEALGYRPYAVYGGKVYSVRPPMGTDVIPHDTPGYATVIALAERCLAKAGD